MDLPKVDLFVVETPLQMLNAIEARHHFPTARSVLVVLTSPPFPKRKFDALIDVALWKEIFWVQIRDELRGGDSVSRTSLLNSKSAEYRQYYRQFRRRRKLNAIARSRARAGRLFLGNYLQEYMRHFANQVDRFR